MRVLLTGSTGYIGRRLKQELLKDENINLRLLVRNNKSVTTNFTNNVEIVEGDSLNKESLISALKDVDKLEIFISEIRKGMKETIGLKSG